MPHHHRHHHHNAGLGLLGAGLVLAAATQPRQQHTDVYYVQSTPAPQTVYQAQQPTAPYVPLPAQSPQYQTQVMHPNSMWPAPPPPQVMVIKKESPTPVCSCVIL